MQMTDIQHIITGLVTQIGKNDMINLTPGRVITAFLKDVQGDCCTLICNGKEVAARLETELPAGQHLKLLVEGEKNGKTILKLISNNADDDSLSLRNITGRLGLPEDSKNLKLVGEMIKQQMPLTPVSTGKLSGFIKNLNIPEPEIWIPVFMENNGLALTRQNLTGVTGLLTDLQFINKDLAELSTGLQNLITRNDQGSGLVEMAKQLVNTITQFEINSGEGHETLKAKLELAVRMLLPNKEPYNEPVVSKADLQGGYNVSKEAAETGNPVRNVVSGLAELMENENGLKGSTANQSVSIKQGIHGINTEETVEFGELRLMLEKIVIRLQEQSPGEHKDIIRLIQNVTEKIEFIRNFNVQTEPGRENMMVFYSTVRFEDRNEPLRLVVKYRDGKEKSRNFSACKLEVKLNTPGLGSVKCEVQVANKSLTLQFITTNEPAGKALDMFAGVLANRLSQMAYTINYLSSRVETETDNGFWPAADSGPQGLFQLDLTV